MTEIGPDDCGYVDGPNGVIRVTEADGRPTVEGEYYFFQSSMDTLRDCYSRDNNFPDDVARLFELYNTTFRLSLNGASQEAISSKLAEGKGLTDKVIEGFREPTIREDFAAFVWQTHKMMVARY